MPTRTTLPLNANIRAEMARHGITGLDLARRLDRTQSAVSRRLTGLTPWTVNELIQVARILDVAPGSLLDRADAERLAPKAAS